MSWYRRHIYHYIHAQIKLSIFFSRTAVKEAFQKIDKSGDGKLQKAEVAAAMREIGHFTEEEIDKMIKKADKNNDGVIDLEEFEKEVY